MANWKRIVKTRNKKKRVAYTRRGPSGMRFWMGMRQGQYVLNAEFDSGHPEPCALLYTDNLATAKRTADSHILRMSFPVGLAEIP